MAKREAFLGVCLRCGGSYDMDFEEGWSDHHTAPDGTEIGDVDTGSSPEQLGAKLTQAGDYDITISGYDGDTGDFTVDVLPVTSPSKVTTDFNLLFFDGDGNYLGSIDIVVEYL